MTRIVWFKGLIVGLLVLLAPMALAQERRPHSILVLDQSDGGPFYQQMLSGLRNGVSSHMDAHVTLYNESLDLTRFKGDAYTATLKRYVKEKYQDKSIGVVVAIGAGTAGLVLNWRDELWPGVPIVFALLDEMDVARLKPPRDVTGVIVQVPLADSIKVARTVMPDPRHHRPCRRRLGPTDRVSQLEGGNSRRDRRSAGDRDHRAEND